MQAMASMPEAMAKPAMARVGEVLATDPRAFLSVHTAEGLFTFTTSSAFLLTGRQAHELAGTPFYDLVHPDDVDAVRAAHQASARPPESGEVVFRIRHVEGHYTRVHSQSWGTADETGALSSLVCLTDPVEHQWED